MIVFDTNARRVVKTIPAPGAHGVLVVPSLHLGRVLVDVQSRTRLRDQHAHEPVAAQALRLWESGNVAVFAERGRALKKLGLAFLAPEAHTVAVDSSTHLVYFPLQDGPTLRIMKPTG